MQSANNHDEAKEQLDRDGITVVANALSANTLDEARCALEALAHDERRAGTALLESGRSAGQTDESTGPNQRILRLIGKGRVFHELALAPFALTLIADIFGENYGIPAETVREYDLDGILLSSLSANIAVKGGRPQEPHTDQGFAPGSTPYPLIINVIYMITDFTPENGATLMAPGSHRQDTHGFYSNPPACIPVCGRAGSAIVFDGRIWHGTGMNVTDQARIGLLATFCRPFVRQFENFALTLPAHQRRNMSPRLLSLLGFRVWMLLGGVNGERHGTLIST